MKMKNVETIQMKIKLDGIKPDIWRRFIIDSTFTLHKLHETIQIVMGWYNSHLYEFDIHGGNFGVPDDEGDFLDNEVENAKKVKVGSFELQPKDKFRYVYDFGDDWQHTIIVEKVLKIGEDVYPICLDGERNCPPEDCGSIPGYEDIVNAIKKPTSKEAKEIADWLGETYDSEKFDIEVINERLKELKKVKRIAGQGRKKVIGSINNN
jgi:hypothetical protein